MAVERSDKAYEYWRDASLRFDYFVTAVSGALTAYIGQSLKPQKIGLNPESVELLALLLLTSSVIVGLKRIEEVVEIFKKMHARLYHSELRGNLLSNALEGGTFINKANGEVMSAQQMIQMAELHKGVTDEAEIKLNTMVEASTRYYKLRNRLLLTGFLLLIAARVLTAYTK
jgi:hypothetical protein